MSGDAKHFVGKISGHPGLGNLYSTKPLVVVLEREVLTGPGRTLGSQYTACDSIEEAKREQKQRAQNLNHEKDVILILAFTGNEWVPVDEIAKAKSE